MNEATTKLIEELASKLGTTTEHLWGVLIKQAPISGTCDVAVLSAWLIIQILGFLWIRTKIKEADDKIIPLIACLVATLVWIAAVGSGLHIIIASFINPEYWALKQLIP